LENNNNYIWGHARRFNSYAEYFRLQFGERVQKLSIDAGSTCPNRDGTISTGGCTYCNNDAFNPSYCQPGKTITKQLDEGIEFHLKRYRRATKYLAYFQAYSNTYGPIDSLKKQYNEALAYPGVIGLVIGTRPDCIDDEKLSYLKELSQKHYIIVEYGIESCYNKTLQLINRGHNFEQSLATIEKTYALGVKCGAHIIFGLPGESREEMLEQASILSKLPLDNIKFHQLQIIKDTAMEKQYLQDPSFFNLFSLEEYVDFIVRFLEKLNPAFVVERFTGEVPPRFLASPNWGLLRNDQIVIMIEKELEKRNIWQGKLFGK
jgi:radical SAM protein (TIGR01212 family)